MCSSISVKVHSRGDISLFIVLVVGVMLLGSAVLLGLILARQNSLTHDLVASERAFYAASAGVEKGFYELALAIRAAGGAAAPPDIPLNDIAGMVDYGPGGITSGSYEGNISRVNGQTCGTVVGTFAGEQRRIQIGPDGC